MAAKQAELGQRKRRAAKHHAEVEASVPVARVGGAARGETPSATPAASTLETPTSDVPRRVFQERPAPAPSSRTHNPYIWPEIKRIGIVTVPILIILAVFTVVLR
jgi:hypothetical protein